MRIRERIKRIVLSQTFLIVALCVAIFVEVYGLIRDVQMKPPVTQYTHTDDIEPWMSVGYINFVYNLPDPYLKEKLGITDIDYPNIRLKRISLEQNIPFDQLHEHIERLIREYRK